MERIGAKLKAAREAKGLSQEDAAGSRMATRTLSRLESGIGNPTLETLEALANVYGTTVGALIEGADVSRTSSAALADFASAADFLSRFANLSPVFQRMVLTLVYKDKSYTQGIQVPATAQTEIQKLFGPLLKVRS